MSVAKAASAGAWSAIDIALRQGLQFVVSLILARLLAPGDFGLMALLAFFSSLSIVFVQGGLSLALVQRTETSHAQENAVFWTNLLAGIFFGLILIALAPSIARFYGYPLMDPLMFVVAAQIVLSSLGAVQTSLLTRTLRFDQLTKTGIVSSIASGAAGLGAAYGGWGIWALAVQLIVQAGVGSAALWWVSDWRPSLHVRFTSIRDLFRFGLNLSLSSTLEVLYANGFILIFGKVHGAHELGLLTRAISMQALPTGIISAVISRTALPIFAQRYADKDALLRGFRMSVGLAILLSLPLMFGLAVLSDLVIFVLLGPKWMPAAPVLAIAAVSGALLPFHVLNLQLLLAGGESKAYLKIEIQKKIVGTACFGVGVIYGMMGIAYASLLFGVAAFYINAAPTKATLNYGMWRQTLDVRGEIAAATLMAAGVYLLRQAIDLPPLYLMMALIAAGGVMYLCLCVLFRLESFKQAIDLIKMLARNRGWLPGKAAQA